MRTELLSVKTKPRDVLQECTRYLSDDNGSSALDTSLELLRRKTLATCLDVVIRCTAPAALLSGAIHIVPRLPMADMTNVLQESGNISLHKASLLLLVTRAVFIQYIRDVQSFLCSDFLHTVSF